MRDLQVAMGFVGNYTPRVDFHHRCMTCPSYKKTGREKHVPFLYFLIGAIVLFDWRIIDRTFRAADKAITGTVWVARVKSRPLRQTISRSRL